MFVRSRVEIFLEDLQISPISKLVFFTRGECNLHLSYYSLQKPKETPYYTKNILHNTTILRTYNQIISVKQSLLTLVYSVQTFRGFFDSFLRLDGAFNDASLAERADFRFLLRVWRLRVRRGWRVGG